MGKFIKQVAHVPARPLSIERDMEDGREIIVIEGVRYEADYFRTFGAPEPDVLYAVQRLDEGCVKLVIIQNADEAKEFFDEILSLKP